jgi:hypothetical protein
MGRIYSDPGEMHAIIHARFIEVIHRFLNAFSRALPHLSHGELLSRFRFMVGAMVIVLVDPISRENMPPQPAVVQGDLITDEIPLNHFIAFLSAGMRAPSSEPAPEE